MRFIIDKSKPADFNMAADVYLLERCGDVVVRFYSWARPSITLGYMQNAEQVLADEVLKHACGVDWVKRPTGGRAVLHDGDVTYSCAFPKSVTEMGRGITETYRLISKCLMNGLERASIKCAAHDSDGDLRDVKREVKLPCFLAPNREEIMVGGKKLVGSAQKRTASAVLQHGSIPITAAYRDLPNYLRIDRRENVNQQKLLAEKSCCAGELVSGASFETLVKCLTEGFAETLPFEWEVRPWDSVELSEINSIARDRIASSLSGKIVP